MYELTAPSRIDAHLLLPASKSMVNRWQILMRLCGQQAVLPPFAVCDDTQRMNVALASSDALIDVGNAGTCLRFLAAYLAARPGVHIIDGSQGLRRRPIGHLVEALRHFGAEISYVEAEGYAPLKIVGKRLSGGEITMPGTVSSQFISALLLIAPTMEQGLHLHLSSPPVSKPYIDLTISMMEAFGVNVRWLDSETELLVEPASYTAVDYPLESDWTAASYWYELLTLLSQPDCRVALEGLHFNSPQGDDMVKYLFHTFGIKTKGGRGGIVLTPPLVMADHGVLPPFDFDFTHYPDLVPAVVCTCIGVGRQFHFVGLESLHTKESDRIEALQAETRKLGFVLESPSSGELLWNGSRCKPTHEPIDTHSDHRMAMAFAPLAVKFPGLKISNPEVVSKSYPAFWQHLEQVGFALKTES